VPSDPSRPPQAAPASPAEVRLQEITSANRTQVESLRVLAEQEDFVAGVGRSLADAAAAPGSNPWYRAVYAGDVPVGFVMIGDDVPTQDDVIRWPYYLWRMLIDGRYQGRGYGSAALDLLTRYLRTRPGADELVTSVVPARARRWASMCGTASRRLMSGSTTSRSFDCRCGTGLRPSTTRPAVG